MRPTNGSALLMTRDWALDINIDLLKLTFFNLIVNFFFVLCFKFSTNITHFERKKYGSLYSAE